MEYQLSCRGQPANGSNFQFGRINKQGDRQENVMRFGFLKLSLLMAMLCHGSTSNAAIVSYADQGLWQAATGPTLLENFNSSTPGPFANAPNGMIPSQAFNGFTVGGEFNGDYVGVARSSIDSVLDDIDNSPSLAWTQNQVWADWGSDVGNGNVGPSITLNFSSAITALGFDWLDLDPTDQYDVRVLGQQFAGPPFVLDGVDVGQGQGLGSGFFGVTSDTPFTSVSFNSVDPQTNIFQGFAIDNVRTGNAVAVPEPSSLAIIAIAAGIAASTSGRRNRNRRTTLIGC
ncbi:MAG: hypothetical protein ACF787_14065 [Rhodopirellula sp. JB053]